MFTLEQIESADEDYIGFCTNCEAEHDGCEPDVTERHCEECGQDTVYGAMQLAIMGLVV